LNAALAMFETSTEKRRHTSVGNESYIDSLEFSPDGRRLAVVSLDQSALVGHVTGGHGAVAKPSPAEING
jgi:WD40 repeat protein